MWFYKTSDKSIFLTEGISVVLTTVACGAGAAALLIQENEGSCTQWAMSARIDPNRGEVPCHPEGVLGSRVGYKVLQAVPGWQRDSHSRLTINPEVPKGCYQNDRFFRWAMAVLKYSF